MVLKEIKELTHLGKYNEALDAIVKLSQEDMLDGIILKSRILERKGELKEALEVAEQALKESLNKGTELHQLQAFINLGYVHLALRNIPELDYVIQEGEKILSSNEIPLQDFEKEAQGSFAYLHGYLNYLQGDVYQALAHLEKSLVIRQALTNQHEIVDALTALGWLHLTATRKRKLALDYFKRSLSLSETFGNKTAIAHSLNRVGCYYLEINNYDLALSHFEKSLAIYQELENKRWLGGLCNNIAIIYRNNENYDLSLNYLERSLAIWQEFEDKDAIALVYLNIGVCYQGKGDLDQALDYFERSNQLYEEVGNKFQIIFSLLLIGDIHYWKGDLNLAHNHYNKCLIQGKETKSKINIAWALLRLALISTRQGELEEALKTINRSLNIFTEVDDEWGIIYSHSELGIISKLQGEYELSIKYLEEALDLTKQAVIGRDPAFQCSYFLFHLILIAQELDSFDQAKEYLKQLHELQQKSESKHVNLRTRFAEAVVLKMSKRGVKKLQAQQKFQAIINEDILDFNITILAMLNLCELLILEMKISETAEDLLQEVNTLSDNFYEIAQNQKSSLLTVMAILLKTKLALVRGEVEQANFLLSDAKRIASEKKLVNLLSRIKNEQETVQAELDWWDDLIRRKASIQERIEHARITDYLMEAKKIQEAWIRPSTETLNQ
ncbi:MAG: tetratricopeptide repeat protein [Candidatus Hodarchaeota archaeon]